MSGLSWASWRNLQNQESRTGATELLPRSQAGGRQDGSEHPGPSRQLPCTLECAHLQHPKAGPGSAGRTGGLPTTDGQALPRRPGL